jgi:hypothetical protein
MRTFTLSVPVPSGFGQSLVQCWQKTGAVVGHAW